MRSLQRLNLCGNCLGPDGARALATGTVAATLEVLHLGHDGLGDAGLQALQASAWPRLRELNVRANAITTLTGLADAFPVLERLGLDDNPLRASGLADLRPHLPSSLRAINLAATELDDTAATDLLALAVAGVEVRAHANEFSVTTSAALRTGGVHV